jgi:sulfide:quinone oxidoreductase
MELKTIDKGLTVSPQISAADVAAIKKEGFRSIICNRPDGEGADQPTFAEIEKAAKKAGIRNPLCRLCRARSGRRRREIRRSSF